MDTPLYFYTKNDPYYEFSNFAPFGFEDEGVYWPTIEHYFQAQKFEDAEYRKRIQNARSAKDAKSLGQSRAEPLRGDWEEIKEEVMKKALLGKFSHAKLKNLLLSTDNRDLIEAAPSDYYWGCGKDGSGRNRLGELLMEVRAHFAADRGPESP